MNSARSINWTPAMDERIRTMRGAGKTWVQIAEGFELSGETVKNRARDIGMDTGRLGAVQAAVTVLEHPSREPLPAGHPLTWNAINAGLTIAGARFPHPVRMDLQQSRISSNSPVGIALRNGA